MANISEFSTDQVFRPLQDLKDWVQDVARSQGYVTVTKRSTSITFGTSKVVLSCDRGVIARNKDAETKKINCPFELRGKYVKARDGWTLRVVRDEHNHEPSMYMECHSFAMRLTDKETRLVHDLTDLNVRPLNILSTIKEQNPNNVYSLPTIYNCRHRYKISQREGRTPIQNVMHILHTRGYNFQYHLNESTNKLEELFFMHPISLKMWQAFPHVVLMDATYQTNKYNLHFLEIVGVTSTNKTFSIAFAFMDSEKTSNYIWALTCLKLTINDSFCPRVIVTDRDLALMKACEDVFPQSNHLLCRWHIFQDITKNCKKRIKLKKTWNSLYETWKKLVASPTSSEYMQAYADLQSLLYYLPDVFGYLYNVWLEKYHDRFISLWTDKCTHFGNSTTNRVESQHAKLKKHLESRKRDLDKFIYVIETVVQSQDTAIKDSFTRSIIIHKPKFNDGIFSSVRCYVSEHALDKILKELYRSKEFVPTPENCGCQLRTCFGLPCAHELAMYVSGGLPIPLDSIDVFWKTLDLKPCVVVDYGDLNVDHHMQRFRETLNNQPDHVKYNSIRRMEEIIDPSKVMFNEPSVKKNNRGRPKVKRAQHQSQAPHRYSCSDLDPEPPRHSSPFINLNVDPARHSSFFMGSNEEPVGQCSYRFDLNVLYDPLLELIPSVFHRYIERIQNLEGDGNCGFRAVAVCLECHENEWLNIRHQLYNELLGSYEYYNGVFLGCNGVLDSLEFFRTDVHAPLRHYMLMPETGILIANRFDVIVQFLSTEGSWTFFPTRRGPGEFTVHRVVSFALLCSSHYVMVKLTKDCPMPPISPLWIRHKDPSASGCETLYKSRLDFYKQLRPTKTSFEIIDD